MRIEKSHLKHLPDTNRIGHTCANLNGELFFIWGGSDELSNGSSSLTQTNANKKDGNCKLWIYETLTGYWRGRECSGECPPNLSGSTSCLIDRRMFIFGGHSSVIDNWLNDLYCLDLNTLSWLDVGSRAKCNPVKPIRCDKSVSWSYNSRLYVFGGYGWSQTEHFLHLLDLQKDLQLTADHRWPKIGWNNQLVEFEPRDNTWRWPTYKGPCPSARAAHSGALMGSKYYLFGGRDSRERLNDLYSLDMKTFTWTLLANVAEPASNPNPSSTAIFQLASNSSHTNHNRHSRTLSDVSDFAIDEDDDEDLEEISEADFECSTGNKSPGPRATHESELNDDEDDDDYDHECRFEYPHRSLLLERCSLGGSSAHESPERPPDQLKDRRDDRASQTASEFESNSMNRHTATCSTSSHTNNEASNTEWDGQSDANDSHELNDSPPPSNPTLDESQSVSHGSQESTANPKPAGRSFASFTPISDEEIILFGGIDSQDTILDDCWMYNISNTRWTQLDLRNQHPRLWHSGSRTKNNELVVIGGSCTNKVDEFCCDILSISLEPKSLKRLALDSVSRSIRMRCITRTPGVPSTLMRLIKLRKQAMILTMRQPKSNSSS